MGIGEEDRPGFILGCCGWSSGRFRVTSMCLGLGDGLIVRKPIFKRDFSTSVVGFCCCRSSSGRSAWFVTSVYPGSGCGVVVFVCFC